MNVLIDNDVDLGKDYVQLTDEKKSIPCEYYGDLCENEAKFLCLRACCGVEIFLCEDCFFAIIEILKNADEFGSPWSICVICSTQIVNFREWLKFVGRI